MRDVREHGKSAQDLLDELNGRVGWGDGFAAPTESWLRAQDDACLHVAPLADPGYCSSSASPPWREHIEAAQA